ncbi:MULTISPECIES: antitoxin Xre/MbcA/ParS toxin-binding domain-containing protein [unclassified Burkholderia]|uniref:type II RES/Xre toxin-antitoxin system antitoxin n=1 Tax=unclassified Burkholderia TaxID=2613784 RepID=UPI0015C5DD83|nr:MULTISPECIES: antitoxin Xre/MbcA/ParS toxin-binding domain-containing protein [unclassified Burkholderia]
MTATSSAGRQPAKRAAASRAAKATGSANGLGTGTGDFDTFRRMAPMSQRRAIADGFDAAIIERVARELLGVPVQTLLNALSLPSSTILRKIAKHDRLSQGESDRVARVLYVLDLATDLFEDGKRAAEWMSRANAELDGLKPIEVLDVQPGYDRVRDILNRAQFGVAA